MKDRIGLTFICILSIVFVGCKPGDLPDTRIKRNGTTEISDSAQKQVLAYVTQDIKSGELYQTFKLKYGLIKILDSKSEIIEPESISMGLTVGESKDGTISEKPENPIFLKVHTGLSEVVSEIDSKSDSKKISEIALNSGVIRIYFLKSKDASSEEISLLFRIFPVLASDSPRDSILMTMSQIFTFKKQAANYVVKKIQQVKSYSLENPATLNFQETTKPEFFVTVFETN